MPDYIENKETNEKYVQGEGCLRLYLTDFSGELKGISYHRPQFVNPVDDSASDEEKEKGATEAVTQLIAKYGNLAVLNGFNSYLSNNVRAKVVNSKIPKFEDEAARVAAIAAIAQNSPVVFTVEDAINFKPGERELSLSGIMKQIVACNKNGQFEEARKWMMKAMELNSRQEELTEAMAAA